MTLRPKPEPPQAAAASDHQAAEAAADERETIAITKFFTAILAEGLKPDCRRLGHTRPRTRPWIRKM